MISFNNDWEFVTEWSEDFALGKGVAQTVRLPHTVREIPQHYADDMSYQMVSGYRHRLVLPEDAAGRRVFVRFEGAAHIATVYLDGKELATHNCGYTAFSVELTGLTAPGQEAWLAVRLDSTENPAIPPFGHLIDYLTYGGIYRPCWLDIRPRTMIEGIYVTTPTEHTATVALTLSVLDADAGTPVTRVRLLDAEGKSVLEESGQQTEYTLTLPTSKPWSLDEPYLYTLEAALLDAGGAVTDVKTVNVGFRTIEFRADGFYLNGTKTFLRGLNRHQSYPYVGYAAPDSLQREDARILKEELGVTAVRTSHYPQSQAFVDACDRLGLLVFTEMPGWQHIGDTAWKQQAVENVREMVHQYRNHPSVILWGVRINESLDDDEFYRETNAVAHALDKSRPTSGVRYLEKSSLLEDVYAFNDFSFASQGAGVRPKEKVIPDTTKPFLVSEHNGHMFPTKACDTWERRTEHALRHARVQNDAAASGVHAGCFGWCMFDYPTHRDFGSGDRVCYHGVMDAFRNPKLAAAMYASQQDRTPVLEIGSSMDIGDYPAGDLGDVWVFTNADEVRLYKNGEYVASFSGSPYGALPHGPVLVDDVIGELLVSQEDYPEKKAELARQVLMAARRHGPDHLPPADRIRYGLLVSRYEFTDDEMQRLYQKYASYWGSTAACWRFDAVKDGQVVLSRSLTHGTQLRLSAEVSAAELTEGDTYDMALVRLRILDEGGQVASYAQLPLHLHITGEAELVGPTVVTAEGGMTGCLIRTVGKAGKAVLSVIGDRMAPLELRFTIRKKDDTVQSKEEQEHGTQERLAELQPGAAAGAGEGVSEL